MTDGGLAGLFWSYLWTFIGFGFVMFSLGEMASMFVRPAFRGDFRSDSQRAGLPSRAANTIGFRSLPPRSIRNP